MKKSTSWGKVAAWYDEHLKGEDTYHAQVLAPNVFRLVDPAPGKKILDLGCGQGYFSRLMAASGAEVLGVDIAPELIKLAKEQERPAHLNFGVLSADNLHSLGEGEFDAVFSVLALQNIEKLRETFQEAARVLKPGGAFVVVLNHPAFRIPKASEWGFDEEKKIQYRRVDRYLSELRAEIEMHPGKVKGETTLSFHRPLQQYSKAARSAHFLIRTIEEWISHRTSDSGYRAVAENAARKEIPLFMALEFVKPA